MRLGDDQVVAGGLQWDEIEVKQLRRRANPHAHIGLASLDGARHFKMGKHDPVVSLNLCRLDSGCPQPLIEQQSCPRAFFPIDDLDRRVSQIRNSPDGERIALTN